MVMLLTALAFIGLTAICMLRHAKTTRRSRPDTAPAACPRCRTRNPNRSSICRGCGVPLQAYEMVMAPTLTTDPPDSGSGPGEPAAPLHAVIRGDVCVGCGTCVPACPEPGAIRLEHKLAVVDLDRCKGHAACAAACPMSAIVVTSGAAVQQVTVPLVNAHFESGIPGLYVVGELGGRGLIKNAINEGKIAIEHVAARFARASRDDRDPGIVDVLIVGSGPAGLSAGLEAQKLGLRTVVLEQGSLSDSIRKYPRQKLLLAEPVRTPLYGRLWVADASKEELLQIWETIIADAGLDIRCGQRVEDVRTDGHSFLVTAGPNRYRARKVVLAMGRRGTPRRLEVPGEDLEKVLYDIVEMETFAGKRVLVVGGGDSAIESAVGLAHQDRTTVTLSHRGTEFSRAKDRNRKKLEAAIAANRVQVRLGCEVREIHRDHVVLEQDGRLDHPGNDFVVVRIGGELPYPFLERIGIRMVRKEIALPSSDPQPVLEKKAA